MMTFRNIAVFIIPLIALTAVSEVKAQDESASKTGGALINVDYSIATPLGATRDFASSFSAQGLGLEARFYRKYIIVGLGVSWQIFRDEKQAPGTSTGAEYEAHRVSLMPLLGTAYFVVKSGRLRGFVGLGGGAMMARLTLDAQAEQTIEYKWYGALSASAGALVEITPGFGLESKLRFVAGLKDDHKSPQMMQLTIGFTFFF